ncbi:hypothetical protein FGB62_7g673 [Gracilaria domingensis]|nr:hypothetical protein FGB62_7g673 [Gracilaria domingensis]
MAGGPQSETPEKHEDPLDLGSSSDSRPKDEVGDDKFLTIEYDDDAWDDTALIEAYERAVESYGSKKGSKNNQHDKGRSETIARGSRQRPRKEGPSASVLISAAEPSRKRKAFSEAPEPPSAPHVKVSKRMKRDIHNDQAKSPPANPDGPYADVALDTDRKMMIPPPPPPVLRGDPLSEELEHLLKSWYEAGYRAGLYVGKQSR